MLRPAESEKLCVCGAGHSMGERAKEVEDAWVSIVEYLRSEGLDPTKDARAQDASAIVVAKVHDPLIADAVIARLKLIYPALFGAPGATPQVPPENVTNDHLRRISVPFSEGTPWFEALRNKPARLSEWIDRMTEMLRQGPPGDAKGPCLYGTISGALASWLDFDPMHYSFLDRLHDICTNAPFVSVSEGIHPIIDPLVRNVLAHLAVVQRSGTLVLFRNKKHHASARSLGSNCKSTRPDVGGYSKGAMTLMAVEDDEDDGGESALSDIRRKANFLNKQRWGGLWFHFAYTADRNTIQFLLITDKDSLSPEPIATELPPGNHARIFPLSPRYSLHACEDKQRIAVASINMFRAILTLCSIIVPVPITYYLPKKMNTGTEIEIRYDDQSGEHLYKRFTLDSSNYLSRWHGMLPLYRALTGHTCPSLVKILSYKINRFRVTLKLAPVGLFRRPGNELLPETEEQLRSAVRCTLQALVPLHAVGWAHCDIHWSNVVALEEKRLRWLLIDLEFAAKWGTTIEHLEAPPAEKTSSAASDVYMVGALVRQVIKKGYSDACSAFSARLMAEAPQARPMVAECLADPWLQSAQPMEH